MPDGRFDCIYWIDIDWKGKSALCRKKAGLLLDEVLTYRKLDAYIGSSDGYWGVSRAI